MIKPGLFTLLSLITIVSFNSCKSSEEKKKKESSALYTVPAPQPIPAAALKQYEAGILAYYNRELKGTGFNGEFLVAKNGTIIVERYEGQTYITKGDTINEHTALHIASTSKTITSGAVLKLWEQGKLKLDDPLSKYFPGFPYEGITIKMLLNQRSGLPGYHRFEKKPDWDFEKIVTNKDVLQYLIQYQPKCDHAPDRAFQYSNTNYALLALIIEQVSGKSYPEFIKETFFVPLGMNDSYVYTKADSARSIPSFDWRGRQEAFGFLDMVYGDKNIYSTVRDLLKWDQALYGNFFKPETLKAAFTPYSNEKRGINNYGLGWRMKLYPNGKKIIFHNGWWHGNNSCFQRLIQDSATIIVLGNRYNTNIYHSNKIANVFAGYFEDVSDDE